MCEAGLQGGGRLFWKKRPKEKEDKGEKRRAEEREEKRGDEERREGERRGEERTGENWWLRGRLLKDLIASCGTVRGGEVCVLPWWECNWADALHSACAFPGISLLFFPVEEGREGAKLGRGSGLPHLGAPPRRAGRWGRRGTQELPSSPALGRLGCWRLQQLLGLHQSSCLHYFFL